MGSVDPKTYYRDHWVEIEPERLAAYEQMFEWRPLMDPLLAPADIGRGQCVLDYGCGPGGLSVELARRVGDGHVHAIDLNEAFVSRARKRAAQEGLAERITVHHVADDRIPLADASIDRVVAKNVLEYVSDPASLLAEFHRVLRPGGRAHAIDSDWGLLAVEPIGPERMAELFAAASVAYRTPLIGRKLYGVFRGAGFAEVQVQVLTPADTTGFLAPIVFHMASYARASGLMEGAAIDRLAADLERAIAEGTYLLVLPQFLVTGTR